MSDDANTDVTTDDTETLSSTIMADTVSLLMQNAVNVQHGMQTIGNTTVSASCALIISSGKGG